MINNCTSSDHIKAVRKWGGCEVFDRSHSHSATAQSGFTTNPSLSVRAAISPFIFLIFPNTARVQHWYEQPHLGPAGGVAHHRGHEGSSSPPLAILCMTSLVGRFTPSPSARPAPHTDVRPRGTQALTTGHNTTVFFTLRQSSASTSIIAHWL